MATTATSRTTFAMEPPSRTYKVSSAALRTIGEEPKASRRRRRVISQSDREWQSEAFDYAEKVGELGALLELQANTVSLCGFPVRRWDEDSAAWAANDPAFVEEDDPGKTYDARPGNVMRAFLGPDGGPEELIRRAAYHLFCTGETNLLGTPIDEGILWEFLSVEELRLEADGTYRRYASGFGNVAEELKEGANDFYTARLHQSSARYSALATSQVKRVLPICQEIVTLTMMVDAVAKSRVSANLLFIPDELTFAPDPEPAPDEDLDPSVPPADESDRDAVDEDSLIDELFDHMTAPLTDPGSASRIVPIIIRGKAEFGKEIRVISLARELDMWAQELRMEALGRLAQGLDAPPEVMTGKATANHWTAANIDSEFIVKHIQPTGRRIAAFLTTAYLRPMLVAYEGMSEAEAENFMVEFDPSPVIARADEAKSARDLSDWLSDEALLTANGFTKADLASTETLRQRRLWELVKTQPAVYGKLLPLLKGFEDIDPTEIGQVGTPLNNEPPQDPNAPTDPNAPSDPNATKVPAGQSGDKTKGDKGPVKAGGDQQPKDKPSGLALMIERIATCADQSLLRARERAVNRAVSTFQSDPIAKARMANMSKSRVLSSLSPAERQRLATQKVRLLDGAWDDFTGYTRSWIADYLMETGASIAEAEATAATAAAVLQERLDKYAEDTMFLTVKRGGNGLNVPHDLVADVVEQAVLAGVS